MYIRIVKEDLICYANATTRDRCEAHLSPSHYSFHLSFIRLEEVASDINVYQKWYSFTRRME